jgi:hypothetical protein
VGAAPASGVPAVTAIAKGVTYRQFDVQGAKGLTHAHLVTVDLRDTHVRLALEAGAKLAVDTDAHSPAALGYSRFGVMTARRGWATAADVVNTRDWPEAKALLKAGR